MTTTNHPKARRVYCLLGDHPDVLGGDELGSITRISRTTAAKHAWQSLLPCQPRTGRRMMAGKAVLLRVMGVAT